MKVAEFPSEETSALTTPHILLAVPIGLTTSEYLDFGIGELNGYGRQRKAQRCINFIRA
jgi:hypothetical protein